MKSSSLVGFEQLQCIFVGIPKLDIPLAGVLACCARQHNDECVVATALCVELSLGKHLPLDGAAGESNLHVLSVAISSIGAELVDEG